MARWEQRGRGWESLDTMLGTVDTSQTSPRTYWSGTTQRCHGTIPSHPSSSHCHCRSRSTRLFAAELTKTGKKVRNNPFYQKKKNTLLLQRAGKEKEPVDSVDRSRNCDSFQSLTQGTGRHRQDSLSQGNCSARSCSPGSCPWPGNVHFLESTQRHFLPRPGGVHVQHQLCQVLPLLLDIWDFHLQHHTEQEELSTPGEVSRDGSHPGGLGWGRLGGSGCSS